MLRLSTSAGMAATRSTTRLILPAAPSLFCSAEGNSGSSMAVVDSGKSSATASIHSKVQDEKLPEWYLYEYAWCGPRWRMSHEFEEVKNKYPKIPVEKMDTSMFWEKGQRPKLFGFLNINVYSVMVKADFKGKEVVKRTMLVMGRDPKELEAAVRRLNKFRTLKAVLKDLF